MATVTYVPEKKQSLSAMRGLINYCTQGYKVTDQESGRRYISGVNCNGENVYKEFVATKSAYGKFEGMNLYQYVQSFSPRENVNGETAHKIALEFADKAWHGHEVLVTTHVDVQHIHSHFVINSVNYENGYKLRQPPNTLKNLRTLSDDVCKAHGLEILKPYGGGGTKMTAREYHSAMKGESWKFRLMGTIDKAMNKSGSRGEFIANMNYYGYQVLWTDERKYITYTCPNNKKCRDRTLHIEKYEKENMEYELQYRENQYKKRIGLGGQADGEELPRHRNDAEGQNASYGSDSGKGLGYDGRTVTVGGGLSAEGIRVDGKIVDGKKDDRTDEQLVGVRAEQLQQNTEKPDGKAESGTDSSREYFAQNGIPRITGWEESRKYYERYLGKGAEAGVFNCRGIGKGEPGHLAEKAGNLDRSLKLVCGAVFPAVHSLAYLAEDSENDPEEIQRKIDARRSAENIGAVAGLVIGTAMAVAEMTDSNDELPEELQKEQQEMSMMM